MLELVHKPQTLTVNPCASISDEIPFMYLSPVCNFPKTFLQQPGPCRCIYFPFAPASGGAWLVVAPGSPASSVVWAALLRAPSHCFRTPCFRPAFLRLTEGGECRVAPESSSPPLLSRVRLPREWTQTSPPWPLTHFLQLRKCFSWP